VSLAPSDLSVDPRVAAAPILTPEALTRVFAAFGRRVVTFAGFGELGYQDEAAFDAIVRAELDRFDPPSTIVNTGTLITRGFQLGVAAVYPIARARGFLTTGVHPSVALAHAREHALSPAVERIYFVEDTTWGGYLENTETLSNTLTALLAISSELVAIGGGDHTAQEVAAFMARGKAVRFIPAEMHHATTRRWSQRAGVVIDGYEGAAQRAWARVVTR
jgi:hypothetical protein